MTKTRKSSKNKSMSRSIRTSGAHGQDPLYPLQQIHDMRFRLLQVRTYSCFSTQAGSRHQRSDTARREAATRISHHCRMGIGKTRGPIILDLRMNNKNEGKPKKFFEIPEGKDTHLFWTAGRKMTHTEHTNWKLVEHRGTSKTYGWF